MTKRVILLLLIVLFAIACQTRESGEQSAFEALPWIQYKWVGIDVGKRHIDHAAILLPITVEDLPGTFLAQFDLGATRSIFYENALKNYFKHFPKLAARIDTTDHSMRFDMDYFLLRQVAVTLGKYALPVQDYVVYKNFGEDIPEDSMQTGTQKLIGTIGMDICKDRVVLIDYARTRLCFVDSLSSEALEPFEWVDCKIEAGRIKLPMKFGNEIHSVLFDTGSSIFPILTDSTYWNRYADLTSGKRDTLAVPAWGQTYHVYGAPMGVPVSIGNWPLEKKWIYLSPRKDMAEFFRQEQVMGITGNAYFLNETIAIDFKHARFGILRNR